ncbi:hypothetical protein IT568_11875, partial [bacterium]|nr:hypothetical protein [bacterium]
MKNFDINQETRKRINLLLLGFTFFAIIILAKLFTIQVKDKSYYEALAKKQHLSRTVLNPIRG